MANHERSSAKEQFWRAAIERQATSGLSVRAFCRQERLGEASFYAWRRTIGERDAPQEKASAQAFVPAVVTSAVASDCSIVLELAGGRVLRFPASMPVERVAELVHALEAKRGAARDER
jgi:transposase-like protein